MGFERGAIVNTLGEHIENLIEPIGNLKGTFWEQRKTEKIPLPPTQNLK
jgi:hypothetical protein